jgi:hypothetical protein
MPGSNNLHFKVMKRLVFHLLFVFGLSTQVFGQAKKPTIMVVPSDAFCFDRGYTLQFDDLGTLRTLSDYRSALQKDNDLRMCIAVIGGVMSERGFDLKDLEAEMKLLETQAAELSVLGSSTTGSMVKENPIDLVRRNAKADFIIELDYTVNEGAWGAKSITFTIKGLDSFTSKQQAVATGVGTEAPAGTPLATMLKMDVSAHMENFCSGLLAYFQNMFEQGREARFQVRVWESSEVNLETEFSYPLWEMEDELGFIIEEYFRRNTVQGRFSVSDATESTLKIEQARIDMVDDKGRAVDARLFMSGLRKHLAQEPFNLESKIYTRGLGEAWLIIGEK